MPHVAVRPLTPHEKLRLIAQRIDEVFDPESPRPENDMQSALEDIEAIIETEEPNEP